jgi:hypothetical protein
MCFPFHNERHRRRIEVENDRPTFVFGNRNDDNARSYTDIRKL